RASRRNIAMNTAMRRTWTIGEEGAASQRSGAKSGDRNIEAPQLTALSLQLAEVQHDAVGLVQVGVQQAIADRCEHDARATGAAGVREIVSARAGVLAVAQVLD